MNPSTWPWRPWGSPSPFPCLGMETSSPPSTPITWLSTSPEFQHFAELLKGPHTDVIIIDPRDLVFSESEQRLHYNDRPVDLIYKRILAVDLERPEMAEVEANLRRACELDAVCMVNSLGSRMTGCKYLLSQVCRDDFEERLGRVKIHLTETEREVRKRNIPWSAPWHTDEKLRAEVIGTPRDYVLKSYRGYGSKEVEIAVNIRNADDRFNELWGGPYIVQELLRHGRVRVPIPTSQGFEWEYRYYILGAYVIDGVCTAIEAKVSQTIPVGMKVEAGKPTGFRTAVFPTRA